MIYKICTRDEWRQFRELGKFAGSPDDLRDGFVHLSGPDQVARTAGRFFAGRTDLVLLAVDPLRLGDGLRWESAGGANLYPHFYAPLPIEAIVSSEPLALGSDGRHLLPPELG